MTKKIIAVSGGADPVHLGHVRMIDEAAKYGNVVWILNSDVWLKKKKGYVFMPWEERAAILMAFRNVYDVIPVDDTDGTVCEVIKAIKPDYFGNGGDRSEDNTPETEVCYGLDIEMIWGLGGEKIQSSSDLVDAVSLNIIRQLKRW